MIKYSIEDTTLTDIADAIRSKTGETSPIAVPEMAEKIKSIEGGGVSSVANNLILTLFRKAVYTEDVSEMITALEATLSGSGDSGDNDDSGNSGDSGGNDDGGSGEVEITVNMIQAFYMGDEVAVGTELSALREFIVVDVYYSDGSVGNTEDYTLSGTIVEGSNTITVSYGGESATFTVTGVVNVTEEIIPWIFANTINTTTYEYTTLDMSNGAGAVYCSSIAFLPVSGGTIHVDLDTTKVSKYKFRLFIYDSEGNAYKSSGTHGSYQSPISGDLSNIGLNNPGSVGRVYVNGSWSYKIPDGYSVGVQFEFADALQNSTIVDTSLLDANGKIYGVIDAIARGEVLTAKIVREG